MAAIILPLQKNKFGPDADPCPGQVLTSLGNSEVREGVLGDRERVELRNVLFDT